MNELFSVVSLWNGTLRDPEYEIVPDLALHSRTMIIADDSALLIVGGGGGLGVNATQTVLSSVSFPCSNCK